ncbi:U6 small nuclear RNA (adenine-(43)-N(6))-methyltransferase [Malaya genurostris]|uniref:U6 small nuclear RNA (adenine-(43)-N(6))-methyltransferase n=1 Tax=Malaya genurostris TaxID=325434 RepID=UPI0026F40770|nr:U6 small nuclear RNA (adenine-(43)-N(6))-methyltransferase [Malaya genurostris]
MSMNKFMHPRNIYRQPPNFDVLVRQFPEMNNVVSVGLDGRIKLDYKNRIALQLLTRCLLKRDFDLDIELPSDKLIPTLPLRLNYVLWLEDFETAFKWNLDDKQPRGLDIGCGASCIYPILCIIMSKHRWKMTGLEQSPDSVRYAKANVEKNNLTESIEVVQQNQNEESIVRYFLNSNSMDKFDFCMCNPPFYDEGNKEAKNRTGKRKAASNACTGSQEELYVEGGEISFIKKLIDESFEFKDRISIYTTMIGHKQNFEEVIRILKTRSISNMTTTRFCQGNTTRWAVAWSFSQNFMLSQVPDQFNLQSTKNKLSKKRLEGRILSLNEQNSIEDVRIKVVQVLSSLGLQIQRLEGSDENTLWELTALENTWSHQRRKRRESKMKPSLDDRNLHNELCENDKSNYSISTKRAKTEPLVKAVFCVIQKPADGYYLTLSYLSGSAGKNVINEILQYVKNSLRNNCMSPEK